MHKKTALVLVLLTAFVLLFPNVGMVNAVYSARGPRIDHLRYVVVRSPDAQVAAMNTRLVDSVDGLIRPGDVENLAANGKTIVSAPGFHMCYIGFNLRRPNFGPQSGGLPGLTLRHAIAHLIPKATLVATVFKYIVVKFDTYVPPANAEWHNPVVDKHPFDPVMARNILLAGGYTFSAGTWRRPGGAVLDAIEFMSPTYEVAPTSATIVAMTTSEMRGIKLADGTPAPLPVTHAPTDFGVIVTRVFELRNFDMYFLCWGLSRFPLILYYANHPSQDMVWGDNAWGINNPALTTQLDILWTDLDHAKKVAAVMKAQELMAGSAVYETTTGTDGLLPYIPVYSRNYFDAYQPELAGIVNSPGYGSTNTWTFSNIRWASTPTGPSRISDLVWPGGSAPTSPNMIKRCLSEYVEEPFNPLYLYSAYAADVTQELFDGQIDINPYTHEDLPMGAVSWSTAPWGASGMSITFTINQSIYWHDGHKWDEFDLRFSWEYLHHYQIPGAWAWAQYFHHSTVDTTTHSATAYLTTKSQWFLYNLAGGMTMPEHIWGSTKTRGGRANVASCTTETDTNGLETGISLCTGHMHDGTKTTCQHNSGCVIDAPDTVENEILQYEPRNFGRFAANAPPAATGLSTAYPWMREVIGTGPFMLYRYSRPDGIADLVAFDHRTQGVSAGKLGSLRDTPPTAAAQYYKTPTETESALREMFWAVGDVNKDGAVNITDLVAIALVFGSSPPTNPDADLNKDNVVDLSDMIIAGKHYGWQRTYP